MSVCWECGQQTSWIQMHYKEDGAYSARCYCEGCYKKYEKQRAEDLKEYIRLKTKLMVERAIRMLERQNVDIYEYKEAIEAVQEFAEDHPEKFMSADEVVAAIILIYNEVETKVQYKIAGYIVDFYLPTLKAVLEVDGYMHKYKRKHDNRRDKEILAELGPQFEIVRIPTKYIEENAELLVEAVKTIREQQRAQRVINW